ncbi:hypothetical protein E6O75_ATG01989 [Venturia nashicola]|uniref:Carbonic anhydrase n=1 Tax=Venturia nashicola TaxID=86259 RepID=A0A4Z1P4A6_9PEZI|nr:hypothetical protein E6O75_ATG01989 [Venturia nashicola]
MADKITVEELLARNKTVMKTYKANPTFQYLAENQIAVGKTLVISCADPRSDPAYILNLNFGDTSLLHSILRNVGGQVKPLLNDILALDNLLVFNQVMIIHHTDCGTTHFTNEQVRGVVIARDPEVEVEHVDYGEISDLPKSVITDVRFLKERKEVRSELKEKIRGFLYDIETGGLSEIIE